MSARKKSKTNGEIGALIIFIILILACLFFLFGKGFFTNKENNNPNIKQERNINKDNSSSNKSGDERSYNEPTSKDTEKQVDENATKSEEGTSATEATKEDISNKTEKPKSKKLSDVDKKDIKAIENVDNKKNDIKAIEEIDKKKNINDNDLKLLEDADRKSKVE